MSAGFVGSWDEAVRRFVKVLPYDYERAMAEQASREDTAVPAIGA